MARHLLSIVLACCLCIQSADAVHLPFELLTSKVVLSDHVSIFNQKSLNLPSHAGFHEPKNIAAVHEAKREAEVFRESSRKAAQPSKQMLRLVLLLAPILTSFYVRDSSSYVAFFVYLFLIDRAFSLISRRLLLRIYLEMIAAVGLALTSWAPWHSSQFFFDDNWFQMVRDRRELLAPALTPIVRNEIQTYLPNERWILEIGSGQGGLAKLISENDRHRFVQSDYDKKALDQNSEKTLGKLVANVYSMPFSNKSVPAIISLSTLDALDDLESAAEELARVLPPDGIVMSFHDNQPQTGALHSYLTKGKDRIELRVGDKRFPKNYFSEVITFNLETLKRRLELAPKDFDEDFLNFFSHITRFSTNPAYMFSEFSGIYRPNGGGGLGERMFDAIAWREEVDRKLTQLHVPHDVQNEFDIFSRRFKTAFEAAGFSVLQNELVTKTVITDRVQVAHSPRILHQTNVIGSEYPGQVDPHLEDPSLPVGKVRITAAMHIIVVQKRRPALANSGVRQLQKSS